MVDQPKQDYWTRINKDLSGQNGLIYIMYLGRETTAGDISKEFKNVLGTPILKDPDDQVAASSKFLERNNYISLVRMVDAKSKVRTANLEPLKATCEYYSSICVSSAHEKEELEILAKYISDFPQFVSEFLERDKATIRGKEWSYIWRYLYGAFGQRFILASLYDKMNSTTKAFKSAFGMYLNGFLMQVEPNIRLGIDPDKAHEFWPKISAKIQLEDKKFFLQEAKPVFHTLIERLAGKYMNREQRRDAERTLENFFA